MVEAPKKESQPRFAPIEKKLVMQPTARERDALRASVIAAQELLDKSESSETKLPERKIASNPVYEASAFAPEQMLLQTAVEDASSLLAKTEPQQEIHAPIIRDTAQIPIQKAEVSAVQEPAEHNLPPILPPLEQAGADHELAPSGSVEEVLWQPDETIQEAGLDFTAEELPEPVFAEYIYDAGDMFTMEPADELAEPLVDETGPSITMPHEIELPPIEYEEYEVTDIPELTTEDFSVEPPEVPLIFAEETSTETTTVPVSMQLQEFVEATSQTPESESVYRETSAILAIVIEKVKELESPELQQLVIDQPEYIEVAEQELYIYVERLLECLRLPSDSEAVRRIIQLLRDEQQRKQGYGVPQIEDSYIDPGTREKKRHFLDWTDPLIDDDTITPFKAMLGRLAILRSAA